MKHKFLSLFIAIVAITILYSPTFASVTINGIAYELEGTTATVVNGGNYTGTIVIPASVTYNGTTYSVTGISDFAFQGCSGLTSVTIPNSVTSIGRSAFEGCSGLTGELVIPNSVTSIGNYAFEGCSGLTSIEIPNSIKHSITKYAFRYCYSLTSVIIGDSVPAIDIQAFVNCYSLTNLVIGKSVTDIHYRAFDGCTNLQTVTLKSSALVSGDYYSNTCIISPALAQVKSYIISDNITKIGNHAFSGCTGMTSVNIPNSVTSIGWGAFSGCSSLTSVTIPNSVTSIGDGVFDNCSGLTSMVVESGNTKYDSRNNSNAIIERATNTLIAGCQSTIIPNNVTSIGDYAFIYCTGLTSITIPNSVTSIGLSAFSGCSGLTSITIPNSVTSIGKYAFSGCSGLTSVTIPNSVTSIGGCAFDYCTGLTSVTWNAKNCADFGSSDALFYGIRTQITSFAFGDNVEHIPAYLCREMNKLTSITIPSSVTSIGYSAFGNCSSLTKLYILTTVVPAQKYTDVFYGCNALSAIYVPCGTVNAYKSSWSRVASKIYTAPFPYTITTNAENGTVSTTSTKSYTICDVPATITCTATPDNGYHFTQWSDGNTDNPRTIILASDTSFTAEFEKNSYTISTTSANPEWGTTAGDKSALYLEKVVISATANYGYHFVKWNDNNTSNPRTISVTKDATYTATFAKNTYSITKIANSTQGSISGVSQAEYLDNVTLTVNPNYGYHFTQWSDGNTENPRTFVLTRDTTFTAEFVVDKSGTCGKNNLLQWTFANDGTLTISGNGELTENYTYGVEAPNQMQTLIIEKGVTAIGAQAFKGKTTLQKMVIGSNVTAIGNYAFADINNRQLTSLVMPAELRTIGDNAFSGNTYVESIDFNAKLQSIGAYAFKDCYRVSEMTCLAVVTPNVGTNALSSINENATLCVPAECLKKYKVDPNWGRFDLCELGSTATTTDTKVVTVEPTDNTALFIWPTENNAGAYTLKISKDGVIFCTLVFNDNGQLIGIAFAPSREEASHAPAATMSVAGMSFTVTGLNSASKYAYRLVVADDNDKEIQAYSGEFATTGYQGSVNPGGQPEVTPQGIDQATIEKTSTVTKFFRNGQLFIQRGNELFNAQGARVK